MGSDSTSTDKVEQTFLSKIIWWGFWLIFSALSRWRGEGAENFPSQGGVLLVTNHLSYVDPPFIFITMLSSISDFN